MSKFEELILRWYQRAAVDATYEFIRTRHDNPCVVVPTGGGKTAIISTFVRDVTQLWGGRILVMSHVRELIEQTERELNRIGPDLPVGVFAAGLKRKEKGHAATLASVQSIWKLAFEFDPFDIIVVDEAHLISADEEGMYRAFLRDAKLVNPHVRVIGLTATPYRLKTGAICGPDSILNAVCFEVGVRDLISQGFLSRLVSRSARKELDLTGITKTGGDFNAGQVERRFGDSLQAAVAEAVELCAGRKSCLVFAAGKDNGARIASLLVEHGQTVAEVYSDTLDGIRDDATKGFKARQVRWLVNVNVYTTGFDATNVDAVVCMRPTTSMGLWSQMVGRGLRLHPGKADCLVLDYGGNLLRHGPIDLILPTTKNSAPRPAPVQTCSGCRAVIAAGYAKCPECGAVLRDSASAWSNSTPTKTAAIGSPVSNQIQHYDVESVEYSVYKRRGWKDGDPVTMLAAYRVAWNVYVREWICFEHAGFAGDRAYEWWRTRSNDPHPDSVELAVKLARGGSLAQTLKISVDHQHKSGFERIVKYSIGPKPERAMDTDEMFQSASAGFLEDCPF